MKTLPSRAYSVRPPTSTQPLSRDGYVTRSESCDVLQQETSSAVSVSSTSPACGTSGRERGLLIARDAADRHLADGQRTRRLIEDVTRRFDLGQHARGHVNNFNRSASHSSEWMLNSMVRDALLTSVTC